MMMMDLKLVKYVWEYNGYKLLNIRVLLFNDGISLSEWFQLLIGYSVVKLSNDT